MKTNTVAQVDRNSLDEKLKLQDHSLVIYLRLKKIPLNKDALTTGLFTASKACFKMRLSRQRMTTTEVTEQKSTVRSSMKK